MNFGKTTIQRVSASPWRLLGSIIFVAFLAAIVEPFFSKPPKTNGMYLRDIIETHTLEKTAARLVTQMRASSNTKTYKEDEWRKIEQGLSNCLVTQANKYALSDDPYLNERANMDTPTILANRFLKSCGAID